MSSLETEVDEEKRSSQIVDYLQGPRKKRKNFIVSVFGQNFDTDVSSGITAFLKKSYPNLAVTSPKNIKEFTRLFSRQINLLIADDQFCELPVLLEEIRQLKSKKHNQQTPVLFFTENAKELIEAYHCILLPFQEIDNYVVYRNMPSNRIYSRIQGALNLRAVRKSRRFDVNIPVRYFDLSKDKYFAGSLVELSIHGGVIQAAEDLIYKQNDQIKIHLPVKDILPPKYGEFMRIPAKIRRVMMGGNKAAVSWEHLSETQQLDLTSFVLEYVNTKLVRIHNKMS